MQNTSCNTTGERIVGRDAGPGEKPALLDVRAVAAMLGCSPRNVYRLADAGRMPRPVKIGRLVRWSRAALEIWIADDCPTCRNGGAR